jgi:hypothetical protein
MRNIENQYEEMMDQLEQLINEPFIQSLNPGDYNVDSDNDSTWVNIQVPQEVVERLDANYEEFAAPFEAWANERGFYGAQILSSENELCFSLDN